MTGRELEQRVNVVSPGRPRRRRTIAIVIILVVVASLVLSIITQPWSSLDPEGITLPLNSFLWIVQVLVSFIAILASVVQIAGLDVRELFSTRPAGASVEAFPFHVIRDFDKLLDYLFPDPTASLLPDRSVPFLPRIVSELESAFRQRGQILIRGRSKTGKTRETVELLRRWWHTGPTVLLAKNHVGLYPPYNVPDTLPVRNLVLLFDDVDRYCGDADAVRRLDQTIAFFANLCHDPGELRVIATARQEPEFWGKLRYDETTPPWAEFEILSLPALPPDGARRLIDHLSQVCGVDVDLTVAEEMATKNDGTFLNLVLSFRGWLAQRMTQIGPEQAEAFEGNLVTTWRRRYERVVRVLPEAGPIYAAVDLLQRLGVPLRPALITDLATEMNLSRTYHLLDGLLHWITGQIGKLDLALGFGGYRDPRHQSRRRALHRLLLLLFAYVSIYLLLCFAQTRFFGVFATTINDYDYWWLRLLLASIPLLVPASLALLSALRWRRRRSRRRVQDVLDRLLATEVPLRGSELCPYEGQFEGKGVSRSWCPSFYAGQRGTAAFRRLVAPRLATFYCTWAEKLHAAGELRPARSLAGLARALAPTHPMPPFMLGRLWYDEGDFRRALAEFARSRVLNPAATTVPTLERIAWCFYRLGEYDRAETVAGQALALMSTFSAARWVQGLARLQQGRVEPGLADCHQAALAEETPPPDLATALTIALTTAESRSWARQVSRLLKRDIPARKRHTALWRRVRRSLMVGLALVVVLMLLTMPYLQRTVIGDPGFMLPVVNVVLRLYPQTPFLLKVRGWTYYELGDYERAIADYTEAIRLDPDYDVVYNNRGWTYYELGDYERAIADFTEAIRLDPDYTYAYRGRGWAYYELGDYEQAIADFTEAIRLDPDYYGAYNGRGWAYYELGEYEQAIADFTEAIRLEPDYARAYSRRGQAHSAQGNLTAARADWERAIELYEAQERMDKAEEVRSWLSELEN